MCPMPAPFPTLSLIHISLQMPSITAFLRSPQVSDAVMDLLKQRDGLMLGICNGFQALIKLGLVPYGEIIDTDETCPTLTFNIIGRHQSRIVQTRVASTRSPWLSRVKVGDIISVPISQDVYKRQVTHGATGVRTQVMVSHMTRRT